MNRNSSLAIVAVVIVLALGLFFYLRNSQTAVAPSTTDETQMAATSANTASTAPESSTSASASAPTGATKEFTVSGSNFKFEPATLTVNKGDTVKITFKNSGGMHNLMIDEFKANTKTIQSGQEDTITFTADKTGQFEYYCGVGNHRQMGMKGTLTVQ
jgi:plastocyanin